MREDDCIYVVRFLPFSLLRKSSVSPDVQTKLDDGTGMTVITVRMSLSAD